MTTRTRDAYVTPRLTIPQAEALISAAEAILAGPADGDVAREERAPLRRGVDVLRDALGRLGR